MARPIEATKPLKGQDAAQLIESLKTCASAAVMEERRREADLRLERLVVSSASVSFKK